VLIVEQDGDFRDVHWFRMPCKTDRMVNNCRARHGLTVTDFGEGHFDSPSTRPRPGDSGASWRGRGIDWGVRLGFANHGSFGLWRDAMG